MNPDIESLDLKDIHLPDAVSWFPPAPGWWIVLFLLFAVIIAYIAYRRYRIRCRLREEALVLLSTIKQDFQQHTDPIRFLNELSMLYRRVTLTLYPRQEVASLNGQAWLDFLSKMAADAGAHDVYFNSTVGELLLTQQYRKTIVYKPEQFEQLYQLTKKWIQVLPLRLIKPAAGQNTLLKANA